MRVNFSDPLQFNRASSSAPPTRRTRTCRPSERLHLDGRLRARYDWRARRRVQRRRLLRPLRSDQGRPQGLRALGRAAHEPARVRRAAAPRPRRQWHSLAGNLDRCRTTRTCPSTSIDSYTVTATLLVRATSATRSATWTTRRAHVASAGARRRSSTARSCRAARPPTTGASACRSATRRSGCAAPAGFSPRDRDDPFANFFFGGFGNNYVDHARREALPRVLRASRARSSTRSAAATSSRPRSSGTCRRGASAASARPGFHATWLRPAVFVSGLATNLDDGDVRRSARQRRRADRRAAQPCCRRWR